MSHVFHIPNDIYMELVFYAKQHGQNPDALLMALVKEGVEQLKQTDSMVAVHKVSYNPANDPLAPFIVVVLGRFFVGRPRRDLKKKPPNTLRSF